MWDTQNWTSNTALGYSKKYSCDGQSGGVSVSHIYTDSAGTNAGSSLTYTAFNGSSSSQHWYAAALWQTASAGSVAGNQYLANCSTDHSIGVNAAHISKLSLSGPSSIVAGSQASFTATVKAPDGGGTPSGTVALFKQAKVGVFNPPTKDCSGQPTNTSSNQDTAIAEATLSNAVATLTTPALPPGTYNVYGIYTGQPVTSQGLPGYCLTPPQSGFTPAIQNGQLTLTVTSNKSGSGKGRADHSEAATGADSRLATPRGDSWEPNAQVKVVNRQFTTPETISATCPAGRKATQVSVSSPDHVIPTSQLRGHNIGKFGISTAGLPAGIRVSIQLLCRPKSADAMFVGNRIAYGSVWADSFTTRRQNSVLFGGFGADVLVVNHQKVVAEGGPGADRIILSKQRSAGNGGPGNDWIKSTARGETLIVGGRGKDTLIGGPGRTLINALDGKGGDKVICGKKNIVLADSGDTIRGNCQRVMLP